MIYILILPPILFLDFMRIFKKHYFVVFFCSFIFSKKTLFAQENYTISGTVIDETTGETLLGATVLIKETSQGTLSNEYGFYSITTKKGTYHLQASYMGYELFEKEIVLDKNQKVTLALKPASKELKEITVKSDNTADNRSQVSNILSGVSTLTKADIKKLPTFLGEPDVLKAVLTMPGVTTVGEGTPGFNVRGGNIDQNLILLDEAPIYSSSHAFGFFSIFNPDAVKYVKLYKGGIPARFGGRASSVLDIRQIEGSLRKFKAEGGVGVLFSRLVLEGPILKDKLSYMFSGRRSYFDLAFPFFPATKNSQVYFYDMSAKITWKINENNTLYFSGYFGADVFSSKQGDNVSNEDGSKNEKASSSSLSSYIQNNRTATLRWNHVFSDALFMNLSSIYSRYNYGLSSENSGRSRSRENLVAEKFDWKSNIENYIIRPDFSLFLKNDAKLRFGMDNTFYRFAPAKVTGTRQSSADLGTEKLLTIAPYLSYDTKWGNLAINAGLRYSWSGNIGGYDVANYREGAPKSANTITETISYKSGEIIQQYHGIEPRLAMSYRLNDANSLKLSYNRVFQYLGLISNTAALTPFDIWRPVGKYIKPLEVNQVALGYAADFKDKMYNFTADIYYKTFKNIIEYKDGARLFLNKNIEKELLPAGAFSAGMELSIHKARGRLQGNANYTFSRTRRKTNSPFPSVNLNQGNYYPSNFDRPHVFNLTMNYTLSKKWEASAFFTYQTGRPITDPTSKFYYINSYKYVYDTRNAGRLPDTHRLDLGLTYKMTPKKRWQGSWSFGVYNAYNRKNIFSRVTTTGTGIVTSTEFSVIGTVLPYFIYNFKF